MSQVDQMRVNNTHTIDDCIIGDRFYTKTSVSRKCRF